jgi:hypothetical protein
MFCVSEGVGEGANTGAHILNNFVIKYLGGKWFLYLAFR